MPRIVGKYLLGQLLASSAASQVYLCSGEGRNERLVAKLVPVDDTISESMRGGVLREVSILRQILHPHVVTLHDVIRTQHHIYLIFQYVGNGPLSSHIPLSEEVARSYTRQLVCGLAYLHRHSILHRDIKPPNVLVSSDGRRVFLSDLGFARVISQFATTRLGTPAYVAPEVINCDPRTGGAPGGYSFAADVWSLGVTLYEALVGELPFPSKDVQTLYMQITRGIVDWPPCLSPAVQHLLRGMLMVSPSRRMSLADVACHPWVLESVSPSEAAALVDSFAGAIRKTVCLPRPFDVVGALKIDVEPLPPAGRSPSDGVTDAAVAFPSSPAVQLKALLLAECFDLANIPRSGWASISSYITRVVRPLMGLGPQCAASAAALAVTLRSGTAMELAEGLLLTAGGTFVPPGADHSVAVAATACTDACCSGGVSEGGLVGGDGFGGGINVSASALWMLRSPGHAFVDSATHVVNSGSTVIATHRSFAGGHLGTLIPLSVDVLRPYYRQLLAGVGHVHAMGTPVRHISPASVLVPADRRSVRVSLVSRLVRADDPSYARVYDPYSLFTAPEVLAAALRDSNTVRIHGIDDSPFHDVYASTDACIDPYAADVWALGGTLAALLGAKGAAPWRVLVRTVGGSSSSATGGSGSAVSLAAAGGASDSAARLAGAGADPCARPPSGGHDGTTAAAATGTAAAATDPPRPVATRGVVTMRDLAPDVHAAVQAALWGGDGRVMMAVAHACRVQVLRSVEEALAAFPTAPDAAAAAAPGAAPASGAASEAAQLTALIGAMMAPDPAARPRLSTILGHPWVTKGATADALARMEKLASTLAASQGDPATSAAALASAAHPPAGQPGTQTTPASSPLGGPPMGPSYGGGVGGGSAVALRFHAHAAGVPIGVTNACDSAYANTSVVSDSAVTAADAAATLGACDASAQDPHQPFGSADGSAVVSRVCSAAASEAAGPPDMGVVLRSDPSSLTGGADAASASGISVTARSGGGAVGAADDCRSGTALAPDGGPGGVGGPRRGSASGTGAAPGATTAAPCAPAATPGTGAQPAAAGAQPAGAAGYAAAGVNSLPASTPITFISGRFRLGGADRQSPRGAQCASPSLPSGTQTPSGSAAPSLASTSTAAVGHPQATGAAQERAPQA